MAQNLLCGVKLLMLMRKIILFFTLFVISYSANAQLFKGNRFISTSLGVGSVVPTNDFLDGTNRIPAYKSLALRFGYSSLAATLDDYIWGQPYMGVGFFAADFRRKNDLGKPMSIYLFQGARLHQFSDRFGLNYEWNLGCSFNWKPYDPITNSDNVAIGSTMNVHIAFNLYFKYALSNKLSANLGVSATHFSNGSSLQPNAGINGVSMLLGLAYNLDRKRNTSRKYVGDDVFDYQKRFVSEYSVLITEKRVEVDTLGTRLSTSYPQQAFRVYGLNYLFFSKVSVRASWGFGIDATYDESAGITALAQADPRTGKMVDRVVLGSIPERFSIGLSLVGETSMPYYSIFAQLGYDLLHAKVPDSRFYQILGVRIPFNDTFFMKFGIRATKFSAAQYLYFGLGLKTEKLRNRYKKY